MSCDIILTIDDSTILTIDDSIASVPIPCNLTIDDSIASVPISYKDIYSLLIKNLLRHLGIFSHNFILICHYLYVRLDFHYFWEFLPFKT